MKKGRAQSFDVGFNASGGRFYVGRAQYGFAASILESRIAIHPVKAAPVARAGMH
jgi:hypothetical protein